MEVRIKSNNDEEFGRVASYRDDEENSGKCMIALATMDADNYFAPINYTVDVEKELDNLSTTEVVSKIDAWLKG